MSVPTGPQAGAPSNLVTITSPDMFTGLMQQDLNRVTVLNFWAPWAQPCEPMIAAIAQMAPKYPHVLFMSIEAEEQPDVSESFDVEAVPTVVLLRGHTLLAKLTGGHVQAVEQALHTHAGTQASAGLAQSRAAPQAAPATYVPAAGAAGAAPQGDSPMDDPSQPHALAPHLQGQQESPADTERRCSELMARSKIMLFMKGQPNMPRCGFSQKTVALLREQHVDFDYYDILSDENVRQTLKVLNDWPTFPQIIVNGELIGGLDILKEMIASGEFQALVASS
ncbi:glutaredoxin [Malassezia equina]|uniref:Glutaredoxin n=1 Tax=Malassezia equina TaxID=1381935 RepID=A0AAF0J4L9_9BASI|nr:glutaredoxin [Malassezia equina]